MKFSPVTYQQIDKILKPWADERGLHIFTRHQDEETRGIYVVDDSGDVYSLGLSLPQDQRAAINIDYGRNRPTGKPNRRKGSKKATLETLEEQLDLVYAEIEAWIAQRGHTRTPVL